MRWLFLFALLSACTPPFDVRYTATYSDVGAFMVNRLALEATAGQGYTVAKQLVRKHDFQFLTLPMRLAPGDAVDVAFQVQIVFEQETARGKSEFLVVVMPRAFDHDREVAADRLPPDAKPRSEALSTAIRTHAQTYEAPI